MAEKGEDMEMNKKELPAGSGDVSAGDGSDNGYAKEQQGLLDDGFDKEVVAELINVFKTERVCPKDLDLKALAALKKLNSKDAIKVLKCFSKSTLEYVKDKSAFLSGQIKILRSLKKRGRTITTRGGPDKAKLKAILDRTQYSLDVTIRHRKYGGPPPDMDSTPPGADHKVFCGNIPYDIYEDTLIPLFEEYGKIWELGLVMNLTHGSHRGYCFVTFCEKEGADEAMAHLDKYKMKEGKFLRVCVCQY